jgi:hypothetical protein
MQFEGVSCRNLPLIFARCLVEDVLLAVYGQDAILHNTLPVKLSAQLADYSFRATEVACCYTGSRYTTRYTETLATYMRLIQAGDGV